MSIPEYPHDFKTNIQLWAFHPMKEDGDSEAHQMQYTSLCCLDQKSHQPSSVSPAVGKEFHNIYNWIEASSWRTIGKKSHWMGGFADSTKEVILPIFNLKVGIQSDCYTSSEAFFF